MKTLITQLVQATRRHGSRRNLRILGVMLLILAGLILVYSVAFHLIMEAEDQHYSWFTGVYWTLTVMSTLGFGDITFHSDGGRAFSMLVLMTGIVFLLILLPFSFIEFFYAPWMEAQAATRAPRELPETERNHVLLTEYDEVSAALIHTLEEFGHPYALLVPDLQEALALHDQGLRVMVGDLDHPDTYRRARVDRAALLVATGNDRVTANIAITVRELRPDLPVLATAQEQASVDLLELAGCRRVLQLHEMMGQSLARRILGGDAKAHVIGGFGELLIAEANAHMTPQVGKTIQEFDLATHAGVTVAGIWERGRFQVAAPETRVAGNTILVLAGTRPQLDRYNELFAIYNVSPDPVIIIGGGRVGRATARALAERTIPYRIVEKVPDRSLDPKRTILGDAAELEVMKKAGIESSPTVIITTNDDDTNIYLALYCRRLNPEIQIISRASRERNVTSLHRAGTDFVMSFANMGASSLFNYLKRGDILMLNEGLNLIRLKLPTSLAGRSLAEADVRRETGCRVVAVAENGRLRINPPAAEKLSPSAEIILIGTPEAEERFLKKFGSR